MKLRTDHVTWQKVDDDVILLDLHKSKYLRLNPTGALLWERLVDGQDEASLVDVLVENYGASPERASEDVGAFLEQLRSSELIS